MRSAVLRSKLESVVGNRLVLAERPAPEVLTSSIAGVDSLTGGFPRGCLTEIFGPASSGRTSLLLAVIAQATAREEVCVLVDTNDVFDPVSAAAAGVDLKRLLWIRCASNTERALKVTDLLVQGGGFGLVVMDLGDTDPQTVRRISLTSWFRLRRAVEHTPTALIVVARESNAKTCASLMLEMRRGEIVWSGVAGCSRLLRSVRIHAERRKPAGSLQASFEVKALG